MLNKLNGIIGSILVIFLFVPLYGIWGENFPNLFVMIFTNDVEGVVSAFAALVCLSVIIAALIDFFGEPSSQLWSGILMIVTFVCLLVANHAIVGDWGRGLQKPAYSLFIFFIFLHAIFAFLIFFLKDYLYTLGRSMGVVKPLYGEGDWTCICGTTNSNLYQKCSCGRPRPNVAANASGGRWICGVCGKSNAKNYVVCMCGAKKGDRYVNPLAPPSNDAFANPKTVPMAGSATAAPVMGTATMSTPLMGGATVAPSTPPVSAPVTNPQPVFTAAPVNKGEVATFFSFGSDGSVSESDTASPLDNMPVSEPTIPTESSTGTSMVNPDDNVIEQIKKYKGLYDMGAISAEEFEAVKKS